MSIGRAKAWIGVDLDGTLAVYNSGDGVKAIGAPIPQMVDRVRKWLEQGKLVKIMTARVCSLASPGEREFQRAMIELWCQHNIGHVLEVTSEKDYAMVELWDDRAISVEKNTGCMYDPQLVYE